MKRFGKIVAILLLLLVAVSCFVACGEVSKHTFCPSCGKRVNYAAFRSGKTEMCPHCHQAAVYLP